MRVVTVIDRTGHFLLLFIVHLGVDVASRQLPETSETLALVKELWTRDSQCEMMWMFMKLQETKLVLVYILKTSPDQRLHTFSV